MFLKAEVRMYGKPAGHLLKTKSGFRFEYLPGYSGSPVSFSIPLREEPYEWDELPPAFAALGPEGWMNKMISMQEKIDENDIFEMLCRYGSDLIGAIEIEGIA